MQRVWPEDLKAMLGIELTAERGTGSAAISLALLSCMKVTLEKMEPSTMEELLLSKTRHRSFSIIWWEEWGAGGAETTHNRVGRSWLSNVLL